ncbi:MAG: alpha/beta hydrolase [Polyangiales bacterium]
MVATLRVLAVVTALGAVTGCSWWRSRSAADAGAADGAVSGPVDVTLSPTRDGWTLAATVATGEASSQGAAVLLVHQLGSSRGEWSALMDRLARPPSITAMAIDLRGHGESTLGPSGRATWERFRPTPAAWAATATDVAAGVDYLKVSGGAQRVVIVGSSLGSTAAVMAAAEDPSVAAVVMISPGLEYRGVDPRPAFTRFAGVFAGASARPALLLAADQDLAAAEAVPALASMAGPATEHEVIGGTRAHGVSLLDEDPRRWDRVEAFIRRALRLPRPGLRVAEPARPPAVSADAGRATGDASALQSDGGDGEDATP